MMTLAYSIIILLYINSNNQSIIVSFSTTLTRTEAGLRPVLETIGKPTIGLLETGIDLTNKTSQMVHKREWFNSE